MTPRKNCSKSKKNHRQCAASTNNLELKSKFRNCKRTFPSNKSDKILYNNNNPKENKKNEKQVLDEISKKKIRFAIKEEENCNESVDNNEDDDEEKENSIISFEMDEVKKPKNNFFLSLKSDGNIGNNLKNSISKSKSKSKYNNDNSAKKDNDFDNISISKKRKVKKTCTVKSRKISDHREKKEKKVKYKNFISNNDNKINNEKENKEVNDFIKYAEKYKKLSNSKKKDKLKSTNNIQIVKSSQFCHPGYNTFACNDSSAKSIQKLSNISIKTKHKIDDENYKSSDEDSKSNEKS